MSTPDGPGGVADDPLDLEDVAADDAAVERLRARVPAGDDVALVLLRELLDDVEADLPVAAPLGRGSTVVTAVGAGAPERQLARSGAVVAVLTAGAVSLCGVAAASTLAPVGSPLHGLGEAVRSAAGAVAGAVTPPETPARSVAPPSASASPAPAVTRTRVAPRPSPAAVSAAARSQAAARQVDQLLDQAAALVADGRGRQAVPRLDLAERTLADVLPADRGDLVQRLQELRAQIAAAGARRTADGPARQEAPKNERRTKATSGRDAGPDGARKAPPKKERGGKDSKAGKEGEAGKEGKGGKAGKGTEGGKGGKDDAEGSGTGSLRGQPSDSEASANPRA